MSAPKNSHEPATSIAALCAPLSAKVQPKQFNRYGPGGRQLTAKELSARFQIARIQLGKFHGKKIKSKAERELAGQPFDTKPWG